jgi:tetratricopeptide (TPR) repeat protein
MTPVDVVVAWWGARAEGVLRASGHPAWDSVLRGVDQDVLATRLPGLAAAVRARDLRDAEGDLRAAAALTQGVVGWLTEAVGASHPETLAELARLGSLALRAGRPERAAPLLEEAAAGLPAGLRRANVEVRCAEALAAIGQTEAARARLEHVLAEHPDVPGGWRVLAQLRLDAGDAAGAWSMLQGRAWSGDPGLATLAGLAATRLGRAADAAAALREAVDGVAEGPARTELRFHLAAALEALGQREEAWRTMEAAMDGARREPEGMRTPERLSSWARLLAARGRIVECEAALVEAADVARRIHGEATAATARHQAAVGQFLRGLGRSEEAMGWLEAALSTTPAGPQADVVMRELVAAMQEEAERVASWDAALAASLRSEAQRRLALLNPTARRPA